MSSNAQRASDDGMLSLPEEVTQMRPSARLVAWSLMGNGRQTQQQLIETTGISQRTIRVALDDLEDYVESNYHLTDARQKVYHWSGE